VGHANPFKGHRALPAAWRWRNLKTKWFWKWRWFLDQFHALDLFELAHGLGSLGGDRAKSVGKFLQSLNFFLLIFVRGQLLLVSLLTLLEKIRVVAGISDQLFFRNFMHLADNFVHELAVM